MNFQYRNNLWKSHTTNSIVPTNSRPFTNLDPGISVNRTPFKPNPIKHWRKQLKPNYKTNSKQVSINQIDAPTSAVHIGNQSIDCNSNYALLKENIDLIDECNGFRNTKTNQCVGGSNHITRRANTNVKKNYHQSYSKYLKSRCKTYEQNSTLGSKNKNTPYSYTSTQCVPDKDDCKKQVIYKPNNTKFSQQGAVSSSTNILSKKHREITRNGATFLTAFGNHSVQKISGFDPRDPYAIAYVKGTPAGATSSLDCNQTFKSCN